MEKDDLPDEEAMRDSGPSSSLVIVDTRDLRSTLPYILYRSAFHVEPVTLEIGDYLLTRDICVERKSIPDLIGSLSSGRLFAQIDAMCRAYAKPVLLIEFDRDRPFHLMATTTIKAEVTTYDLNSRLVLLLLHFPALKIIWSSSPHETMRIFRDLKRGHGDPVVPAPLSSIADPAEGGQQAASSLACANPPAREMLLRMPGVSTGSVHKLMQAAPSMRELVRLEESALALVLGDEEGKRLHRFINAALVVASDTKSGRSSGKDKH